MKSQSECRIRIVAKPPQGYEPNLEGGDCGRRLFIANTVKRVVLSACLLDRLLIIPEVRKKASAMGTGS